MAATERTTNFLKNLFADATKGTEALQAAGNEAAIDSFATLVLPVQDTIVAVLQGTEVEQSDASAAIKVLIEVNTRIKAATPRAPRSNSYAGKCSKCGSQVAAGAGLLTGQRGAWRTEHKDGECVVKVDNSALLAEREALAADLFAALGTDKNSFPRAYLAVPSATGNNDLDFFAVKTGLQTGKVYVQRVIGGHADQRISLDAQVAALKAISATTDVRKAAALYGQEIGSCGACGRHLTDQVSRDRGIGPDCAKQYGF